MTDADREILRIGEILWLARVNEAWKSFAPTIVARTPWPTHLASHDIAAEHQLCIAQAKAVIRYYNEVRPK